VEALDFDLGFVMGSSEVMRRHSPHHLSPAQAKNLGRARSRSGYPPLQVIIATLRSSPYATQI
jgi:hypothetical protein